MYSSNIWLLFLVLHLSSSSQAKIVLYSSAPPSGFNTFDTYGYSWLDATGVQTLLRNFSASPIHTQAGYDLITGGFSGWSQTPLPNGSYVQHLDGYGRPTPAPERFPPGSMAAAGALAKSLGIKFGLWFVRGVHVQAVAQRLPILGAPGFTIDMIVDQEDTGGGKNGSCLWDSEWLGVNASHPAAQAYYNSQVQNLVELGVEVIEADCMMCEPCYWGEMNLMTTAVQARPEPLILYYSPGGGNSPQDSRTVADKQMATFYRTLTDFHGGWYGWGGLQQAIFIAGNFTAAGLHGANSTWPDLDQMPMGPSWWTGGGGDSEQNDRGQTIATLWMMGRYPLFAAGALPLDERTLGYLTNPAALALNRRSEGGPASTATTRVSYEGNCTCVGGAGSCTIPHGPNDHPAQPCLAKWVASGVTEPSSSNSGGGGGGGGAPAWTALSVINLGEDGGETTTGFDDLGLPTAATDMYSVVDVWSGEVVGNFAGNARFTTPLRMHASVLLKVTALPPAAGHPLH